MYRTRMQRKWHFTCMLFLPKIHNLSLTMRKTSDKSHRGPVYKYLTSTPQNCQGHQKQGKSAKASQPRRAQGGMITTCTVVSWIGSWNRKRTEVRTKEVRGKYGLWLIMVHSVGPLAGTPVRCKVLIVGELVWGLWRLYYLLSCSANIKLL